MVSNRIAFAGLALACVTAAASGGYLASTKTDGEPRMTATVADAPTRADARPAPVHETEAVVGDVAPAKSAAVGVAEAPVAVSNAAARAASSSPSRPNASPARETAARRGAASRPRETVSASNTTGTTAASAPPPLERTWPSSATTNGESADPARAVDTAPAEAAAPRDEARTDVQPATEPEKAPDKTATELTVASNSVVGLQVDTAVTSERAKVEDRVEARVVRDVRVDGDVAIPAGTKAQGSVMMVEPGGRFKERARIGIRFHTLLLPDGTRLPITTETIYRDGNAPGAQSAAKIGGGAVAGAILGAIVGGAKGAAVGATAGAGGGTAAVMASERSIASFPAGTEVTARMLSPVSVHVEK